MFGLAGIESRPTGVRQAREMLLARDPDRPAIFETAPKSSADRCSVGSRRTEGGRRGSSFGRRRRDRQSYALRARDLWVELDRDPDPVEVLRGIDLAIEPGERVALMGRNGAGKSTLLRAAAGLIEPITGSVSAPDGIALLTQSPGDFLVRERVAEELPGRDGVDLLVQLGLGGLEDADPRDLSGGQRQRLALAITLAGRLGPGQEPGLIALDEPTRGLDRELKQGLAELAGELAGRRSAVLIATHDVEFAASFADRVVLLGKGVVVADGSTEEVLSGGWYFATEVSRVLELPGVVTPEQGAASLLATSEIGLGGRR